MAFLQGGSYPARLPLEIRRSQKQLCGAGRGPVQGLRGPQAAGRSQVHMLGLQPPLPAPPRPSPARLPLISSLLWLHCQQRDLLACSFPSPSGPEPGWSNNMEFPHPSQVVQLPYRHILNLIIVIITFSTVNSCRFIRFFDGPPI